MSKPNEALQDLHRFYRATAMDQILFGFVIAYRLASPETTVEECIVTFLQRFGLEDTFDKKTARQSYYRMEGYFKDNGRQL